MLDGPALLLQDVQAVLHDISALSPATILVGRLAGVCCECRKPPREESCQKRLTSKPGSAPFNVEANILYCNGGCASRLSYSHPSALLQTTAFFTLFQSPLLQISAPKGDFCKIPRMLLQARSMRYHRRISDIMDR
jgi:hypothetical protein